MKKIYLHYLFCCVSIQLTQAQGKFHEQIPKEKRYVAEHIIDERYGINIYDKLVLRLGGDSIRHCKGYACSGWIQDRYDSGELLHKGYYVEGHLRIFKNFFPNGKVERDYKVIDDRKSNMHIYYSSGQLKSQQKYVDAEAIIWDDYYSNGNLEYHEEYHKSFNYYISQASYFENGKPHQTLTLVHKKKLLFEKKEYFENGNIKEAGELVYSEDALDYLKKGKWTIYNEDGTPKREETYVNGELNKEKGF